MRLSRYCLEREKQQYVLLHVPSGTPRSGRKLIAVLYAYLDASKTEIGKGMTVVAGYLASLEEWERLEAEWRGALEDWKIPRFHHTELNWLVGHEKHDMCLRYFENIIKGSELGAVGAVLQDENWDMRAEFAIPVPFHLKKYSQCLQSVLEVISHSASGEDVAVICDCDDGKDAMQSIFLAAKEKHSNLATLTIGSMKSMLPLQAADLACAWLRHASLAISKSHGKLDFSRIVTAFMPKGKRGVTAYFGAIVQAEQAARMANSAAGSVQWHISYRLPDGRLAKLIASPLFHVDPNLKRVSR